MQYLLHDLLKLPLADRLAIVEKVIYSLEQEEKADTIAEMIQSRLAALQQTMPLAQ